MATDEAPNQPVNEQFRQLQHAINAHHHAMQIIGYIRGADDSLYRAGRAATTLDELRTAITIHRRKILEHQLDADAVLWEVTGQPHVPRAG